MNRKETKTVFCIAVLFVLVGLAVPASAGSSFGKYRPHFYDGISAEAAQWLRSHWTEYQRWLCFQKEKILLASLRKGERPEVVSRSMFSCGPGATFVAGFCPLPPCRTGVPKFPAPPPMPKSEDVGRDYLNHGGDYKKEIALRKAYVNVLGNYLRKHLQHPFSAKVYKLTLGDDSKCFREKFCKRVMLERRKRRREILDRGLKTGLFPSGYQNYPFAGPFYNIYGQGTAYFPPEKIEWKFRNLRSVASLKRYSRSSAPPPLVHLTKSGEEAQLSLIFAEKIPDTVEYWRLCSKKLPNGEEIYATNGEWRRCRSRKRGTYYAYVPDYTSLASKEQKEKIQKLLQKPLTMRLGSRYTRVPERPLTSTPIYPENNLDKRQYKNVYPDEPLYEIYGPGTAYFPPEKTEWREKVAKNQGERAKKGWTYCELVPFFAERVTDKDREWQTQHSEERGSYYVLVATLSQIASEKSYQKIPQKTLTASAKGQ